MAGIRPPDAIVEERVKKIYMLLLNGAKRREISQYCIEKEWKLPPRTMDDYIHRAMVILKRQAEEDFEYARDMSLNRHDDLYFKSSKINDFKTCLAIQRSRDELTGVRSNKLEITGKDGGPILLNNLTDEEVERRAREILSKRQ